MAYSTKSPHGPRCWPTGLKRTKLSKEKIYSGRKNTTLNAKGRTMLRGVAIKAIKRNDDERGFLAEIFREDWKEFHERDRPVQANLSKSFPSIIRAWHRHARGQTDYFLVLTGALRICVYDDKSRELDEIISTEKDFQIVTVPGHYWHGFKVLGNETARLLYFVTKLYDYKNPDEERKPWNDVEVVPKTINGNREDSRAGKPWDWNLPPHK